MKRFGLIVAGVALACAVCRDPAGAQPLDSLVSHAVQYARAHLKASVSALNGSTVYPRSTLPDGTWLTVDPGDWTCGFFPGCLWHILALSGDTSFRAPALAWTAGLESQQFNTQTHDVGFMMFCSYGNAIALSPNEEYRRILLQSALSLSTRYNPVVGCIRSWNDTQWSYPVIIDNMMNLELLLWAARNGGPDTLRGIAVSHALRTMANHFRSDGSTYHVVSYDTLTGAVNARATHQGYSDESVWSRGQAWAIYGFTMVYRETRDDRFLQTAERAAQYYLSHLPADHVPYWDFLAPNIPNELRDVSAAAIACAGLFELASLVSDHARAGFYRQAAEAMLATLCAPPYLSEGTPSMGLLSHGVGNYPAQSEIDVSLIYADYYFLEALLRYAVHPPAESIQFTVASAPAGLTLAVDGVTSVAPQTFTWTSGSTHTLSAPSPQEAKGTRYSFISWSDAGAQTHSIIVDSAFVSDTAHYRTDYQLSVAASPPQAGGIGLSPASPDGYYERGMAVELMATPATDYVFSGWLGDATGTANPDTVLMTGVKSVTATFARTSGLHTPSNDLPSSTMLIGNFPNPFNTATTISYAVSQRMRVTLHVYDGLGQLIATIEDADREAGIYQVRLDAANWASGTYFCRMQAQSASSGRNAAGTTRLELPSLRFFEHTIPLLLLR